jgi:hypothetical protein
MINWSIDFLAPTLDLGDLAYLFKWKAVLNSPRSSASDERRTVGCSGFGHNHGPEVSESSRNTVWFPFNQLSKRSR